METDKSRLKGPQQILTSKGNIDAKKRATYEEITDVKFKNERHEKDRRDLDEYQRQQRFQALQTEAIESSKQNAALEMRWAALKEIDEYESLLNSINEQKESFMKVMNSKNGLIEYFKDELRGKDDDYRKMLKDQNEDIDQIIARMRNQFYSLRSMYLSELQEIEGKYDQDRGDQLKSNKAEIDKKSNRHAELEKKIVEDREATEKRNMDEIEKLRIDYAKSYADKKISMETEIQNLEKCFEDMKALYLLNTEKLDYNFKVLKEKDEENTILSNILKNKRRNYANRLTKARNDYKEIDRKFKQENKSLTEEYKRITRQFKELQIKFKHFEKADKDRYIEIKKMNEAEIDELKEKLIKCDKTVHIQQLGMQWNPPAIIEQEVVAGNESRGDNSLSGSVKKTIKGDEEFQFTIPPLDMEIITEILLTETDFLLDEKTREKIQSLQIYEDDPEEVQREKAEIAQRIKVENLKKTLELDSLEEMNSLYETLYTHIRVMRKGNKLLGENGEEGEEEQQEEAEQEYEDEDGDIEYDPDVIIEALTKFMEEKKGQLENENKKSRKNKGDNKENYSKEEKVLWEKLTHVLPDHTFRIWKVLDKSLSKYHDLLLDRQKLIEQTGDLHNQNEELKNLLNQYFQINHELIIPPTKMIQLEASQNMNP